MKEDIDRTKAKARVSLLNFSFLSGFMKYIMK